MCFFLNCVSDATDVPTERSGSLSEPGSIFFHSDLNLLMEFPLFYWLEKACSAYPRLTGFDVSI